MGDIRKCAPCKAVRRNIVGRADGPLQWAVGVAMLYIFLCYVKHSESLQKQDLSMDDLGGQIHHLPTEASSVIMSADNKFLQLSKGDKFYKNYK